MRVGAGRPESALRGDGRRREQGTRRPTARLRSGEVIAGRFRIVRLLGRGGMGEVFLAKDTRLDRQVASKILSPRLARDPQFVQRFQREARAASALNHPAVCVIHEIGAAEDGCPFIAMEFLDGEALDARLSRGDLPIAAFSLPVPHGVWGPVGPSTAAWHPAAVGDHRTHCGVGARSSGRYGGGETRDLLEFVILGQDRGCMRCSEVQASDKAWSAAAVVWRMESPKAACAMWRGGIHGTGRDDSVYF